jgi:hypothetical protein
VFDRASLSIDEVLAPTTACAAEDDVPDVF